MNFTRTITSVLLLAAFGNMAQAQLDKTRAQVRAELAEAIRTGDIIAGEAGLKLNEIHPGAYPAKPAVAGKTRAQVHAELAEAMRSGDLLAGGESGLKRNEISPGSYPAKPVLVNKTREQVKAELAEAIRTGDTLAGGESGLKLNELYPERYTRARAFAGAGSPGMTRRSAQGSDGAAH
jgi:ribosomal protein L30E